MTQVESFLNLNIRNDVIGALTGELALWGEFSELLSEGVDSPLDLLYAIDAAIVGGLKNQMKWQAFLDSIQNLANVSIQQSEYKGTTLHQVSLPPEDPTVTVHYGYLKNLFLVSFSDERSKSVVDNAARGGATPAFKRIFKKLAADPVIFLQLKLDKLLPAVMASGNLSEEATAQLSEVGPLIGSLSVKQNEAWLKVGTASAEGAIETYGRIASAIAPTVVR